MPENMLDANKAFETIARIIGQKEQVEVTVRTVKKRGKTEEIAEEKAGKE